MIYRALSTDEEATFRGWARDNYEPSDNIWHPVVQKECARINREHADFVAAQSVK
jgi:hypothetical protein